MAAPSRPPPPLLPDPPAVSTDLWLVEDGVAAAVALANAGNADSIAQQAAGDSVTGRFTRPDEVADLVVFLASDRSANVPALTSGSTAASFRRCSRPIESLLWMLRRS